MKTENECKTAFCTDVRNTGGFARRIEDQYGVGIPDMLVVPRGGPVFLIEAKIIRSTKWGATQRQGVELTRFRDAVGDTECGIAAELGFDPANKIMTIRRYGSVDPKDWLNYQFAFWNRMNAEYFLKQAYEKWSS